jgi:hypothetical protein
MNPFVVTSQIEDERRTRIMHKRDENWEERRNTQNCFANRRFRAASQLEFLTEGLSQNLARTTSGARSGHQNAKVGERKNSSVSGIE